MERQRSSVFGLFRMFARAKPDFDWYPTFASLSVRTPAGETLIGPVMQRRINGRIEYRAETPAETEARWAQDQW